MTGTDLCVNKPRQSRSYLNHLASLPSSWATSIVSYPEIGPGNLSQYSDLATGCTTDGSSFDFRQEIFHLSKAWRSDMGPPRPPVKWVPGVEMAWA